MAEMVNLRAARKRAQRQKEEVRADANRVTHGTPKALRELADARRIKAERDLDHHRIEPGDRG